MCKVLEVSRSSYYCWRKHSQGKRELKRQQLENRIREEYINAKGRYGSPRIAEELTRKGEKVSKQTVSKHMKRMGIKSKLSRKYKVTTDSSHRYPVAENLLNRQFTCSSPSQAWVSDITYISTREGFLYLTTVMDLFDRKVIGWSLSEGMSTNETVIRALNMALSRRKPREGLIFHSDRGVQYASRTTTHVLVSLKITQSMSRKGNCWDNAVAESFFKTLKTELIYGNKLKSKQETKSLVFEYIEIWYNRKRRHSFLNYQTIEEFNSYYKEKNSKNLSNVA